MRGPDLRPWHAPAALVAFWFLAANLIQSEDFLAARSYRGWFAIGYMALHAMGMVLLLIVLWHDRKSARPLLLRIKEVVARLPMPRAAKMVVGVILAGQFVCITLGVTYYPFADVGMFRWAKKTKALSQQLTQPKYYYKDVRGEVVPLEIRKQHIFFAADLLGLGYNNEFTFSAAYHYKGLKANHAHLLQQLERHAGIDTLWVGLQTVDFATGTVSFDADPVRAVHFNDTARIFYGPIYVPEHQERLVR